MIGTSSAEGRPGAYTPWCDEAGKVLDDGTIARLDETDVPHDFGRLELALASDNAPGSTWRSTTYPSPSLRFRFKGPASRAILGAAQRIDLTALSLAGGRVAAAGIPVTISRTGYTGDLGYEIWTRCRKHALPLWDALIEAGAPYGITAAGMLALDMARIEAGLMLIDVDYVPARKALIESQTSSPFELDLGWTVNLDEGALRRQEALAAETAAGRSGSSSAGDRYELARTSLRRGRSRNAAARRRLAHQRADLRRQGARWDMPAAAAGRRFSNDTSRSPTCNRAGQHPARKWKWKSPWSIATSARQPAWSRNLFQSRAQR